MLLDVCGQAGGRQWPPAQSLEVHTQPCRDTPATALLVDERTGARGRGSARRGEPGPLVAFCLQVSGWTPR